MLFPEKVGGEFVALHRPNAATPFCRPEMWVARSPDLVRWGRHECLHGGDAEWETGRVGAGDSAGAGRRRLAGDLPRQPPAPTQPGEVGRYSTGLLLLDRDNPARILCRTSDSVFEPTADSSATASCRTWSSPPGSSRAAARTSSTTGRPIRARRWWNSIGQR